jgi:putative FmdB family regulatory protein
MPLYQYLCPKCHRQTEDIRCVADRQDAPRCYFCGGPTLLQISPVPGHVKDPAVPRGRT